MQDEIHKEIQRTTGSEPLADWLKHCAEEWDEESRIDPVRDWVHTPDEIADEELRGFRVIIVDLVGRHASLIAVVVLGCLLVGTGAVALRGLTAVREAAEVRKRLDSLYDASGLESSFEVDYRAVQPNVVAVTATIDPALMVSVAVTYDNRETWRTLYTVSHPAEIAEEGAAGRVTQHEVFTVGDEQAFVAPTMGTRTVRIHLRAKFVPEVIAAFPEFDTPGKTDRVAEFELTPEGIIKLIIRDDAEAEPEVMLGSVGLDSWRWEIINSLDATGSLENDLSDDSLVHVFEFEEPGEYTNISHAIPSATATYPAVSLEQLTTIEIELAWTGEQAITLEPKLQDDHGKIVGTMRFVQPSRASQTLRIPAESLRGYFGVRSFDFSRVRRFELAVARKSLSQAAEGTIEIHRIDLLGTGALLQQPKDSPDSMLTLTKLSTQPEAWSTARSKRATIMVTMDGPLLACKVELPFNRERDEELPWTNLETKLEQQDFAGLQAIGLEVRWDGPAPITIELKLVTSEAGDTYGAQRRVEPSDDFQTVVVYLQDLKFYWSIAGVTDVTRMNLDDLRIFSLGIARKAQDQADAGTLYVKGVRLLGVGE